METMRDLSGSVAVVTGASIGIGRALAVRLAKEGCSVVLTGRNLEGLSQTRKLCGEKAIVVAADLGENKQIENLVRHVGDNFQRVDILWNGACGWLEGPIEQNSISDITALIDSSVRGPIVLTSALMPLLLKSRSPHVVNISADWEFPELEGISAFIAAKRAIAGFGIALQKEKSGRLKVTNVHPADVSSKNLVDATADAVVMDTGGQAIPLGELTDLFVYILRMEGTIVHQINIKPLRQEISTSFI
jgi:NADP-dependent 3-hydroxy acid dehydrogenase YdfG